MPCRLLAAGDCKFGDLCQFDHRKSRGVKDLEDKLEKLSNENLNLKKKIDQQDKRIEDLTENVTNMAREVMMLMKHVYDPPTDTEDMEEDEEMDEEYEEEEDDDDTGEEKEDNGSENPDILDEQQTNHLKKIFNTIYQRYQTKHKQ